MSDGGKREPIAPSGWRGQPTLLGAIGRTVLAIVGVVLLLPGAAAGFCIVVGGADQTMWREFGGLILVGLMAGFFGIALIYRAFFKR